MNLNTLACLLVRRKGACVQKEIYASLRPTDGCVQMNSIKSIGAIILSARVFVAALCEKLYQIVFNPLKFKLHCQDIIDVKKSASGQFFFSFSSSSCQHPNDKKKYILFCYYYFHFVNQSIRWHIFSICLRPRFKCPFRTILFHPMKMSFYSGTEHYSSLLLLLFL